MALLTVLGVLIAVAALIIQIIVWRTGKTDRILNNIHQRLIEIRNVLEEP